MKRVGIDIGSLFASTVVLDGERVTHAEYRELRGDVAGALQRAAQLARELRADRVGLTGNFPRSERVLDAAVCVVRGAQQLLPGCRNIISAGGQSYLMVLYDQEGAYREHTPNPPCASGTGSFLEQQAERLGLSLRELSDKASAFTGRVPSIATRCAVFAKSDIIHSMQEGYSLDAICAGLCDGMGRSIVDSLVKGRTLLAPVGLVGGVAQNARVVASIAARLGMPVRVPEQPWAAGALGAALMARDAQLDVSAAAGAARGKREQRAPLQLRLSAYPELAAAQRDGGIEVWVDQEAARQARVVRLGLDIGSTSTKAALLSEGDRVVAGLYTATRGEPLRAVQELLGCLDRQVEGWSGRLVGAATTGSGRSMVKQLFRADLEVNEISAHARAAFLLHPEADTIIEIGGQDSKFTRVAGGEVLHATMNYVCAAGTGSFIEEQARRLGVGLEQVSALAMGQTAPYTSDRCTVYMERDLNLLLSEGFSREAVLASVLFSVRDNYLSKVVGHHPLGSHVVFQGATARNKALVAAFEQHLGQPVHVSQHCHLAGAIGAALLAREAAVQGTQFRTGGVQFEVRQEPCDLCSNRCTMTVVHDEARAAAWGMKCGRDYGEHRKKKDAAETDVERRILPSPTASEQPGRRGTVGLADALYHRGFNPLWRDFLGRLGFSVVTSRNGKALLAKGRALVNSDFCAPIILAHGAMQQLLERKVDAIFFPAFLNEHEGECGPAAFKHKQRDSYFCYYSQYTPAVLGSLTALPLGDKLIAPMLSLRDQTPEQVGAVLYQALCARFPWLREQQVTAQFVAAWQAFQQRREQLSGARPALHKNGLNVVLAGRPYVAFERALSLGIPELLQERGARLFWQDEFDTQEAEAHLPPELRDRMHWTYGRKLLATAEHVARTEGLYLVYLSCFRCSPDSFLINYVREILQSRGKPLLVLQLDEHSSDVGYTTRIEAALRTFEAHRRAGHVPPQRRAAPLGAQHGLADGDTVLVPYINRLLGSLWAECFRQQGHEALVLDNNPAVLQTGYRYANGGECMPAVAIAGGAIHKVREHNLVPDRTCLYLPTLCMACNFPQFPVMASMALQAAGICGLKVPVINALNPGAALPGTVSMKLFETSIAASVLYKLYHRIKPYETEPGATGKAFDQAEQLLLHSLRRREGLRRYFADAVELFRRVQRDPAAARKPRIAILGDMYVKYNEVVNQRVTDLIEQLGGEVVIPSISDTTCHFVDVDIRAGFERPGALQVLQSFESRYERVAADLLGEQLEPPWEQCAALLQNAGLSPSMAGETTLNVARALYLLETRSVEAIVHLNPMFCCPGVVTASLMRKLQAQYAVPIIDLFYDGTGDPNSLLIPHLSWLVERGRAGHCAQQMLL